MQDIFLGPEVLDRDNLRVVLNHEVTKVKLDVPVNFVEFPACTSFSLLSARADGRPGLPRPGARPVRQPPGRP